MFQFVLISIFLFTGIQAENEGLPTQNHVHVFMPHNDVRYNTGETAELFCDYTFSNGLDQPVTVTWKTGGFIDRAPIFRCKGYTKASRKCTSIELFDEDYYFRIGLGTDNPSLIISNLQDIDANNFWCEISVEGSTNYELGYDTRSVVIYLSDVSYYPPKSGSLVLYKEDVVANAGENITLECVFLESYYGGVYWYKGPSSDGEFELIYSSHYELYMGNPYKEETAHGDWIGRASLNGYSLEVSNLQVEDSGRYWCENRPGEFQTPIIPNGIDAKSLVLEVN